MALCLDRWRTCGKNLRPLAPILGFFHCLKLPPSPQPSGGEVRQDGGSPRRVAIMIPAEWRKKPACHSTQGGLLSGCHKNLESSACQTARMGRSQRDGSLQPGRQMPGGLQLFWALSCGCSLTQGPRGVGRPAPHPLSSSLQIELLRPETAEAGSQAKGNQPLTKQT